MSINRVVISGNLTRDAEMRVTASGAAILNFTVAVNDRVKDGNEWKDRASFVDCVLFGARAEALSARLSRGSKVAVEGKLRWSQWEAKDGSGKRSKIEVVAEEVELMTVPVQPQPQAAPAAPVYAAPVYQPAPAIPAYQPRPAVQAAPAPAQPTLAYYEEDIPF